MSKSESERLRESVRVIFEHRHENKSCSLDLVFFKEEDEFSEVSEVPPREEMVLKLKIVDENT